MVRVTLLAALMLFFWSTQSYSDETSQLRDSQSKWHPGGGYLLSIGLHPYLEYSRSLDALPLDVRYKGTFYLLGMYFSAQFVYPHINSTNIDIFVGVNYQGLFYAYGPGIEAGVYYWQGRKRYWWVGVSDQAIDDHGGDDFKRYRAIVPMLGYGKRF